MGPRKQAKDSRKVCERGVPGNFYLARHSFVFLVSPILLFSFNMLYIFVWFMFCKSLVTKNLGIQQFKKWNKFQLQLWKCFVGEKLEDVVLLGLISVCHGFCLTKGDSTLEGTKVFRGFRVP